MTIQSEPVDHSVWSCWLFSLNLLTIQSEPVDHSVWTCWQFLLIKSEPFDHSVRTCWPFSLEPVDHSLWTCLPFNLNLLTIQSEPVDYSEPVDHSVRACWPFCLIQSEPVDHTVRTCLPFRLEPFSLSLLTIQSELVDHLIWTFYTHRPSSGPYFPYYSYFSLLFFWCSYFSLLFSENALLSLLFSPKMFEVIKKIVLLFPRSLGVEIYLIWAATMQVYKIFHFIWKSFFGTFILAFPFHGNVVLLFRESFVCLLYLFLSLKTLSTTLLSLLFMFEIPIFALLFQIFEP